MSLIAINNKGGPINVIFVHGFIGDQNETWIHPKTKFNFVEHLADHITNDACNTWSFGFDSKQVSQSLLNVVEISNKLQKSLQDNHLTDTPLVFVCHSMGGIIAANMLVNHSIQFLATFFIACPFGGVSGVAKRIFALFLPQLNALLQTTPFIDQALIGWRRYRESDPSGKIFIAYEKRRTKGQLIVDRNTATAIDSSVTPEPFEKNHTEIVKPYDCQDEIFVWVKTEMNCLIDMTVSKPQERSKDSLECYKDTNFLRTLCITPKAKEIYRNLPEGGLMFLSSPSGQGKSAFAAQLFEQSVQEKHLGLFIQQDEFIALLSFGALANYVTKCLFNNIQYAGLYNRFYPESKIRIVIDDLAKLSEPLEGVRRAKYIFSQNKSNYHIENLPVLALCPLQSKFHSAQDVKDKNFNILSTVYSAEDLLSIAQEADCSSEFDDNELDLIVENLGFDPLLINLFFDQEYLKKALDESSFTRIIEKYIETELFRLSDSIDSQGIFFKELTYICYQHAEFQPSKTQLLEWNANINSHIQLISQSKLLNFDSKNHLNFKHDRIREGLLIEFFRAYIEEQQQFPPELLDPYYAKFIGSLFSQVKLYPELIEQLKTFNPVGMIYTLPYLTVDSYDKDVKKWISDWLKTEQKQNSIEFEVASTALAQMMSPNVLTVTNGLKGSHYILIARTRNGCAHAASYYIREFREFAFYSTYVERDQALEQARKYHAGSIKQQIFQLLRSEEYEWKVKLGAVELIGFYSFDGFVDDLIKLWDLDNDRHEAWVSFMWAALRIPDCNEDLMIRMIAELEKLNQVELGKGLGTSAISASDLLRMAFTRFEIPTENIELLLLHATSESIKWNTYVMLHKCPVLNAAQYSIEFLIEDQRKFWIHFNFDESKQENIKLIQIQKQVLFDIWNDDIREVNIRQRAFNNWCKTASYQETENLKSLTNDHALLKDARFALAKIGDHSVSNFLISMINSKQELYRAIPVCKHIWSRKIKTAITKLIGTLTDYNSRSQIICLLLEIPLNDAIEIMEENWEMINTQLEYQHLAFAIGNSDLLQKLDKKVDYSSAWFKKIHWTWGMIEQGREKRISKDMIFRLLKHSETLDQMAWWSIFQCSEELGFLPEIQELVLTYLPEHLQKQHIPKKDDLYQELNEILNLEDNTNNWIHYDNIERMIPKIFSDQDEFFLLLAGWVQEDLIMKRFVIYLNLLRNLGRRSNLIKFHELSNQLNNERVQKKAHEADYLIKSRCL